MEKKIKTRESQKSLTFSSLSYQCQPSQQHVRTSDFLELSFPKSTQNEKEDQYHPQAQIDT